MLFNDGEICEIRFCTKISENEETTGTVLLELTKPRHVLRVSARKISQDHR